MTNFEQGRLSAFIDCLTVILKHSIKHSQDKTTEGLNSMRVLKEVGDEVSVFADAIEEKKVS